jgi:hypothetical protein
LHQHFVLHSQSPRAIEASPIKTSVIKSIEVQASVADVEHPDSIDALTYAVLAHPHVFAFPDAMKEQVATRLARSENAYRNRLGPGVTENQLLNLLNSYVRRFDLPDYAATSPAQLRVARMNTVRQLPVFMGNGVTNERLVLGDSISDVMSPLQAFHLCQVIIDQKILNPDYQDSKIDPFARDQQRRQNATTARAPFLRIESPNSKKQEMIQRITAGSSKLTMMDLLSLLDSSLTDLNLR